MMRRREFRQGRLAVLSARHGIPTVSPLRDYPAAGGLMSYGASSAEAVRLVGVYFKLAEAAERNWRRLNGHNQLPKIILGIKFSDGIEVVRSQAQTAAA